MDKIEISTPEPDKVLPVLRDAIERQKRIISQSDGLPPVVDFKQIRAQQTGANCTAGRTKVGMDALFDNVKLNPGAVP